MHYILIFSSNVCWILSFFREVRERNLISKLCRTVYFSAEEWEQGTQEDQLKWGLRQKTLKIKGYHKEKKESAEEKRLEYFVWKDFNACI